MNPPLRLILASAVAALGASLLLGGCASGPATTTNASMVSASRLTAASRTALQVLYTKNETARKLGNTAEGVLVFPEILKGGFIVGAEGGNGVLFTRKGDVSGYYQTIGASYGFQAGLKKFGYALFLMNERDIANLNRADGWDVGTDPSLVVVDSGIAHSLTATTIRGGAFAFFFNERGLMADVSLKGAKITPIAPGP